jgi:hypothetical protein
VTNAIEPANLTSAALASSAGLFGQGNSGSRNSGSFAALFGPLTTSPAHETTVAASTSVPTAGGNGAPKPAGKPTAANPLTATELQQNTAATPIAVLPSFLAAPVPLLAVMDAALPEPSAESLWSPAASGIAQSSASQSSQLSQTATVGVPAIPSTTDPAASADDQPAAEQASAQTQVAGSVLAAPQTAENLSAALLSTDPPSRNQRMPDQPSTEQTSTEQTSADRGSTDQPAEAVASGAAPATSVPAGLAASRRQPAVCRHPAAGRYTRRQRASCSCPTRSPVGCDCAIARRRVNQRITILRNRRSGTTRTSRPGRLRIRHRIGSDVGFEQRPDGIPNFA